MSFLNRLKKNRAIEGTAILSDSKFFDNEMIPLDIPVMNIAFSGMLDGGITAGLTVFAGPSKHGKSVMSAVCARAFMNKYPEAIMLFYDSEFGTPKSYFQSLGIAPERILHCPLLNIENLKFDIVKQLDFIKTEAPDQKIFIFIDSFGNMASKKESQDALDGNAKQDMTRAKELKSLTRIVTPYLRIMNISMVAVAHTYQTMEMFSKTVVSGGTGIMYSADNVFVMGRRQEKEGKEISGFNLIMNVEKSRYCREKVSFPIELRFGKGINKYTGLLDVALKTGDVVAPKQGWYSRVINGEIEERKWRAKASNTSEFWQEMLESETFKENIKQLYYISSSNLIDDDLDEDDNEPELDLNSVNFTADLDVAFTDEDFDE